MLNCSRVHDKQATKWDIKLVHNVRVLHSKLSKGRRNVGWARFRYTATSTWYQLMALHALKGMAHQRAVDQPRRICECNVVIRHTTLWSWRSIAISLRRQNWILNTIHPLQPCMPKYCHCDNIADVFVHRLFRVTLFIQSLTQSIQYLCSGEYPEINFTATVRAQQTTHADECRGSKTFIRVCLCVILGVCVCLSAW